MEIKDKDLMKMMDIVHSIVFIYGPIDADKVIDTCYEYFPKESEKVGDGVIYQILEVFTESGEFAKFDDQYSFYTQEEMEEILKVNEVNLVYRSSREKVFTPKEILEYNNLLELKHNKDFKDLKKLLKKENLDEETYAEVLMFSVGIALKMGDYVDFADKFGIHNKEAYQDILDRIGGSLPRGFLHGYSFQEMGEVLEEIVYHGLDKVDKPYEYKTYGEYSYMDCIKKVRKLSKTDLFKKFVSDNVLEVLVNNQKVYVSLLGYYNGDRNIIIFEDYDTFKSTYPLYTSEIEDYPDSQARVNVLEICIDDDEGFKTDDIRQEIRENSYPSLPFMFQFYNREKGILSLPSPKQINLIGAVLDNLLEMSKVLDDIQEYCMERETGRIIQFYQTPTKTLFGAYHDEDLHYLEPTFEVDEMLPVQPKTKQLETRTIQLGIYAMRVEETGNHYMTIIHDADHDFILNAIIHKEKDMHKINDEVIDCLKEKNIYPKKFIVNNYFAHCVFEPLTTAYPVSMEIDPTSLNNIYDIFLNEPMDEKPSLIN